MVEYTREQLLGPVELAQLDFGQACFKAGFVVTGMLQVMRC